MPVVDITVLAAMSAGLLDEPWLAEVRRGRGSGDRRGGPPEGRGRGGPVTVTYEAVNREAVAELVDICGTERVVVTPRAG